MSSSIESNASRLLAYLSSRPRQEGQPVSSTGVELSTSTGLTPDEVNDAAAILSDTGFVDLIRTMGTHPYNFLQVSLTPRGRLEFERASPTPSEGTSGFVPSIRLPPTPVGSPYGFTDEDWETVAETKDRTDVLVVVLGHQFESDHYNAEDLASNVRTMMERAIQAYNDSEGAIPVQLEFRDLAAGYGEHLFNEIARDIIGADIAVFETSDLNPNVMIEMGVALTWGVRVLPIKLEGQPRPPSDISGQTWADFTDSAARFVDPAHHQKLMRMVERAARRKAAG